MPLFKSPIYRSITSVLDDLVYATPLIKYEVESGAPSKPEYALIYEGVDSDVSEPVPERIYWCRGSSGIVVTVNARWEEDLGRWYPDRDAVNAYRFQPISAAGQAQQLWNSAMVDATLPTYWSDTDWGDDVETGCGYLNAGATWWPTYFKINSNLGDVNRRVGDPAGPNRLYPDGFVKAWVSAYLDGSGGNWVCSSFDGYNVESVTRVNTNTARINFYEDMDGSSLNACAGGAMMDDGGADVFLTPLNVASTTYVDFRFRSIQTGSLYSPDGDPSVHYLSVIVLGRQL